MNREIKSTPCPSCGGKVQNVEFPGVRLACINCYKEYRIIDGELREIES